MKQGLNGLRRKKSVLIDTDEPHKGTNESKFMSKPVEVMNTLKAYILFEQFASEREEDIQDIKDQKFAYVVADDNLDSDDDNVRCKSFMPYDVAVR